MSIYKVPAVISKLEKQPLGQARAEDSSDCEEPPYSGDSSSTGEDDDENWNDWVSDSHAHIPCYSLFDGTSLPTAEAALKYDKEKYGCDLDSLTKKLGLDFHRRTRLINYIRKNKIKPSGVLALTGQESFFTSDEYLLPVLEDDPLLQFDQDWSDSDSEDVSPSMDKDAVIRKLKEKLIEARKDLSDFRDLVDKQFRIPELSTALDDKDEGQSSGSIVRPVRDDDTHYFESYGMNDIHAVMIRDKVRTSTYASFILNSPELFRDAIVMDVGCGTGILSLFAARAGAKRVFAIDASENIVKKAEKVVKDNDLEDVITVIKGKVESIVLPDGITQVDVIVSEWMGYALLYESMLDSVLVARDRFLKGKGNSVNGKDRDGRLNSGIMVPSQARMLLGLSSANDVVKDRIEFWSDVYGYDMSAMSEDVYEEAIADIVDSESMLTDASIVKDINISTTTSRQLSFSAPFELRGTTPRRQVAHAFILYFDTFFSASGEQVSPNTEAHVVKDGEVVLAEVWRVGSRRGDRTTSPSRERRSPMSPTRAALRRASSVRAKEKDAARDTIKSFTTGPQSIPTHWKQTLFLLREPIVIHEGTIVSGTFHCRKSEENSRELDVEIHYVVRDISGTDDETEGGVEASPMVIQSFKVR